VENLQGAPLLASELEREILPARIAGYRPEDLDSVMASGQVMWVGLEQIGNRDGRIALYLNESVALLLPPQELRAEPPMLSERAEKIRSFLSQGGASFIATIQAAIGGFPGDTRDALWELVWSGQVTNDTFHPLRELRRATETKREKGGNLVGAPPGSPEFLRRLRSRSGATGQGRWSLIRQPLAETINITQWSANVAQQLLVRHGIVLRETAIAENIPRGYPTIYPALKTMEDGGWVRRGMFVAGLGAAQFAMPAAVEMLRSLRSEQEKIETLFLAATDPANPYGGVLPWPRRTDELRPISDNAETSVVEDDKQEAEEPDVFTPADALASRTMSRSSGAGVILINGNLAAFLRRRNLDVQVFLPESEPDRSRFARELAGKLAEIAILRQGRKSGLLVGTINGEPARLHVMAGFLEEAGFVNTAIGFQMRRISPIAIASASASDNSAESNSAAGNDENDLEAEGAEPA
jgi:ATP-dependent Lhr-like helicase